MFVAVKLYCTVLLHTLQRHARPSSHTLKKNQISYTKNKFVHNKVFYKEITQDMAWAWKPNNQMPSQAQLPYIEILSTIYALSNPVPLHGYSNN